MTGLTTHVLDLTLGKPADELQISFYKTGSDNKTLIANFVTNSDGRLNESIFDQSSIRAGWYQIVFHAGKYLLITRTNLFLAKLKHQNTFIYL